jgi:hypothetical protein
MGINNKGKVWIIDDVKNGGADKPPVEVKTVSNPRLARSPGREKRTAEDRPLKRILLTYLLGPFAKGRWHPLWTPVAALGLLLLIILQVTRLLDPSELAQGRPLAQVFHWLAAVALLLVLSGWSLALLSVGETLGRKGKITIPAVLRRPGPVAFLGLWLPGFSQLLAGSPRRAALAMWNLGPLACALFILLLHPTRTVGGGIWIGYERLLLMALLTSVIAALFWISCALDGLRLQLNRAGMTGELRGDRLALWFMASLVIFFLTFEPVTTAENLHRQANALADRGFLLLPLTLERAALHLDDSDPDYWLSAVDYCEELGRFQEAMHLRGKLWSHWQEMRDSLGMPLHETGVATAPRRVLEEQQVPII